MTLEIFTSCKQATAARDLLNIIEAFDGVCSKNAPYAIERFCVVFRIRFDYETESGGHSIKFSIMDEDGKSLIPEFVQTIKTKQKLGATTCTNIGIIGLNGLKLQTFGEYSLELFVDGHLLGSQPLHFQKLENAI